jgi:UDP-glucuronate decarboxylase
MRELAERILRLMNLKRAITAQPVPNDPIQRRCPDMAKARSILGYAPRFNLDEGLGLTLAWYDQHPRLSAAAL